MHWNQHTTMPLAGVTYDAHRTDGIRLEIPATGIWIRIPADRLHPGDEGRGSANESSTSTNDPLRGVANRSS